MLIILRANTYLLFFVNRCKTYTQNQNSTDTLKVQIRKGQSLLVLWVRAWHLSHFRVSLTLEEEQWSLFAHTDSYSIVCKPTSFTVTEGEDVQAPVGHRIHPLHSYHTYLSVLKDWGFHHFPIWKSSRLCLFGFKVKICPISSYCFNVISISTVFTQPCIFNYDLHCGN